MPEANWQAGGDGNWLVESQTETIGFQVRWKIVRELHRERSPYQDIVVVDLDRFGRALFLDRILQVAELDEYIYHEMLAHVPLCTHPDPRRVLIIGGGDGGTLRETVKHPEIEHVDMVELDEAVVRVCRQWLPAVGGNAWDDPRVRLHFADGFAFLRDAPAESYDVILVDCSDPGTPADVLYSEEFYRLAQRALREGGCLVQQALSPFTHREVLAQVGERLAGVFQQAGVYYCPAPSYLIGLQAFVWGSRGTDLAAGPRRAEPAGLRWYTPEIHKASFITPPALRGLVPATR
ncbi:MAG: polyamine aminopropyltransferase [Bacillota bacterium]|nr:MAG: polyamine aminopropyltransferase [Bacillota bacterium]